MDKKVYFLFGFVGVTLCSLVALKYKRLAEEYKNKLLQEQQRSSQSNLILSQNNVVQDSPSSYENQIVLEGISYNTLRKLYRGDTIFAGHIDKLVTELVEDVKVFRPFLRVENGMFEHIPERPDIQGKEVYRPVFELDRFRMIVERTIPAVGSVMAQDNSQFLVYGSCWLVTSETVITNFHVINELKGKKGLCVDFNGTKTNFEVLFAEVKDKNFDVAILKLQTPQVALSPLRLRKSKLTEGENVVCIGFPTTEQSICLCRRMVHEKLCLQKEKQHVSPGTIKHLTKGKIFYHDCSTIGGNSGSPLIHLSTGSVVGLHCGGDCSVEDNVAVYIGAIADKLISLKIKPEYF